MSQWKERFIVPIYKKSRNSSVGIATGYGLDNRMIGVRFPALAGKISLRNHVQTGSGNHTTSYPVGAGGFSLGVKGRGREADTSI
jgi:hypothetical protein